MHRKPCLFVPLLPALMFAQQPPDAPASPVTGLGNLAHAVASLDKTVPFYRDVLGLPVNGARDPLSQKPQPLDADMSRFTATQGASFRAATFRIPGANFGWELTEFTGASPRPERFAIQDPGAATLVLRVRDIEKIMSKLTAGRAEVVTNGGAPVNPTGNPNSKLREVVVRDPDGFFIELQQPDPMPAGADQIQGNIVGGSIQLSIEDTDRSIKFYRDAFGFNARPAGQWSANDTVLKLIGLQAAQWRITHGSIPGQTLDFALIEYKGVPRTKRVMGANDPGSPAFTMVVRDLDSAVAQWKSAGGTVVTTGGSPVKRASGAGNVFVRDVNGFMWELYTRPTPAQAQNVNDTPDAHLAAAKAAAGDNFQNLLNFQCYGPGPAAPFVAGAGRGGQGRGGGAGRGAGGRGPQGPPDPSTWHAEPVKVFDNLYFFGQTEYAVWAIVTSQGIIVLDTIFDYSVEDEVAGGMKKLGLDPAKIKYAIVSHAHPDHDGGARFLQEHYGTRVIMSPADWDVLEKRTNGTKPKRDIEAADGQKLTLGDTTLTMYITPGHTPGTISTVFPVKDNGTTHIAALWGGVGLNADRDSVQTYIGSVQRFSGIVKQAGADIILANHTDWDRSKINLPMLANRAPGAPNPYIVGNAKVLNFLKVAEECATARNMGAN
ncbi:MAG: MBL fold metallo-hydrolase [Bryobacterales bacterium]|nr:MBL fold metallo-hydrolase [Bryobacterales bacterium]